ncbi:helix-turn-helix domain-containing protein [Mycobacterium sp.]|uniref:helix-turn-helix domain-containing protein n=1 Tax=Mycobacterium sp. TaxID=1785 RepID=UPI002B60A337|nr:helix-turn-helix domain-containing protein [Mycobacterium sp.]HTY33629.1 helix-turn-helix domain-containing protein [Mycobacterium sp.]
MQTGKPRAGSPSPPTLRVISVVEFLTLRERPQSSAQIADGLGLSRSTVGAILAALDDQGWVTRLPDLTYRLGPGLIAISERARPALPRPNVVDAELERLADSVGCAVGLSTVHRRQLIIVAVTALRGHVPAGISSGTRLPLAPPAGASIIAHADKTAQRDWLGRGKPKEIKRLRRTLEVIRETGIGVWGAGAAVETVDVIADVVSFLSEDPSSAQLRNRVVALLGSLNGTAYEPEQLAIDDELPVSVLTAPVFDSDGTARWELQIGPFRPAVSRPQRQRYIDELRHTADRLNGARP